MDDRAAFKAAFISECISSGYDTIEKIAGLVQEKQAEFAIPGVSDAMKAVMVPAEFALKWGLPAAGLAGLAALAAPPVIGAMGGHVAARMEDAAFSDFDTDAAKKQELIDEYRRQAEKLRREKGYRQQMAAVAQKGKLFF